MPCRKCGTPIDSGLFCEKCKALRSAPSSLPQTNQNVKSPKPSQLSDFTNLRDDILVQGWYLCELCNSTRGFRFPVIGRCYECITCPAGPDTCLCKECYELYLNGQLQHPAREVSQNQPASVKHDFRVREGDPLSLLKKWEGVQQLPSLPVPSVPDNFVFRPRFNSGNYEEYGSHSFTVDWNGQLLLLTALHTMTAFCRKFNIFPQRTGFHPASVPPLVTNATLYDIWQRTWMLKEVGQTGVMIPLPSSHCNSVEPYGEGDIAAFKIPESYRLKFYFGTIASAAPGVGEPVWLAARSEPFSETRAYQAVVVESTELLLVFKYVNSSFKWNHPSGGPVLNQKGEVVGILAGGGTLVDRAEVGHACNATIIRKHLESVQKY